MPAFPKGSTSGAKAQNAEWFAADIVPTDNVNDNARQFRVTVNVAELDAGTDNEFTIDSGANWYPLANLVLLTLNRHHQFVISIREGDLFNMRNTSVGGLTVNYCRVDEIAKETIAAT